MSFGAAAVRTLATGAPLATIAGGLQLVVAGAFVARAPERRAAHWREVAASLPSLGVAGIVMGAAAHRAWGTPALVIAALGVAIAAGGIASLGGSFAVLPGVRTLRTGGLYRWVRHPIYLGESLLFAAAASQLGWAGALAIVGMVPLLAWRIVTEEQLFARDPRWTEWAARVRWRLVPGIW